jgi:glycerophosphoryl diester phosphodiesterase
MGRILRPLAFFLALGFLILTFVNASWIAPNPKGYIKLIAHRGAYQLFDGKGAENAACTASRIEQPWHQYLENTLDSLMFAKHGGAQMVAIDLAMTSDRRLALFRDAALDCRTDGKGTVREKTLAELQKLDLGFGYTADGGKTFPFRGKGLGKMPALEDVLRPLWDKPLMFHLKGPDPAEADLLAAAIKAAGRNPVQLADGFYGHGPSVDRIRQHFPKAWAFSLEQARACTDAYTWQGWLGLTPGACRGAAIFIPINRQWAIAGWPNRLIARMEAVGARTVIVGPQEDGSTMAGLTLPEQITQVPASYTGYVWVEDIAAMGPAFRPQFDKRSPEEDKLFFTAMERRRQANQ